LPTVASNGIWVVVLLLLVKGISIIRILQPASDARAWAKHCNEGSSILQSMSTMVMAGRPCPPYKEGTNPATLDRIGMMSRRMIDKGKTSEVDDLFHNVKRCGSLRYPKRRGKSELQERLEVKGHHG
jgi:hypothetical protein